MKKSSNLDFHDPLDTSVSPLSTLSKSNTSTVTGKGLSKIVEPSFAYLSKYKKKELETEM